MECTVNTWNMTTRQYVTMNKEGARLTLEPGDIVIHHGNEYITTPLGSMRSKDYAPCSSIGVAFGVAFPLFDITYRNDVDDAVIMCS